MTTRVTEGARRERHEKRESLFFLLGLPPSFLAFRGLAAQRSRPRALPLLNLKNKRDCSQSSEENEAIEITSAAFTCVFSSLPI